MGHNTIVYFHCILPIFVNVCIIHVYNWDSLISHLTYLF